MRASSSALPNNCKPIGKRCPSTLAKPHGTLIPQILPNQLAHLLRAQIIRIVIAGAQNVSAKNDPAFYFRAETFLSRAAVMIEEISWMFGPMSVAYAIKAGEIRRSLRRCQNVIDCNGVIGVRQRNVDNLCA